MLSTSTAAGFVAPDAARRIFGIAVALSIFLLMTGIFFSVLGAGKTAVTGTAAPNIAHLLRMSSLQAGLSTFLSLIVGIVLAWALNRLRFFGRNLLVSLFATAIVAPGIVVAFGMIAVWGRAGWVGQLFSVFSLDWPGAIFGLVGILAAHTILNGAFAARILLGRLDAIPAKKLKTGRALALSPLARFQVLDWPALSGALPGLGAIIFLLTFTSFAIVLLLGGGPANQTLEVAIYSYVRLSFDLKSAVLLALVQLGFCLLLILPAIVKTPALASTGTTSALFWPEPPALRPLQWAIVVLAIAGFGLPLLAVLVKGLGPGLLFVLNQPRFWRALATSLAIAAPSAILTLVLALGLSMARNTISSPFWRGVLALPIFAYLVMPALVLSLGFFLGVRQLGIAPGAAAPFILVLANALLALPFAVSVLSPPLAAIDKRYIKLSRALRLSGSQRWLLVEWPLMGRETGIALALAFCFSLGDLGVIALFGTSEFSTLPWLMFRALGAYRSNDAAAIAALLLLLTLAIFWLLPPLTEKLANAEN